MASTEGDAMIFPCPRCRQEATCFDSRMYQSGVVRRYYQCKTCSCKFYSREVITHINGHRVKLGKKP